MTNNHKGDGAYKLKFERENKKKKNKLFLGITPMVWL